MREIHLWDFDGTLFRSPNPPDGWDRKHDWFNHQDSLGRPCVPDRPDSSWWIESNVSLAKRSISDANTLAILVTGRGRNTFARWRIPELLKQAGLNFDQVFLAPATGVAAQFKAWAVQRHLLHMPEIEIVTAWDDKSENLEAVGKAVEQMGRVFHGHHVPSTPPKAICDTSSPEAVLASRWMSSG